MSLLLDRPLPALRLGRTVIHRTRGRAHGPIARLANPSDVGQLIKPFVFLDLIDVPSLDAFGRGFGWHPHSGIATLTVLIEGDAAFEETTGTKGVLPQGSVEFMRASGGVWHTGAPASKGALKGFQLWIALPPDLENAEAMSQHMLPAGVPVDGPARVLLGKYGDAASPLARIAPSGINYLDVSLAAGERWTYQPPRGHTVGWLAVHGGKLAVPETVDRGELVVFDRSTEAIEIEALDDTRFVLGSALPHPHELVLGYYSVHTSQAALDQGEREIDRIGRELKKRL
jgi:redox-sensitive bicupin YhaK (pirin superfamily)